MKSLSVQDLLHASWKSFKAHWGTLLGALVIVLAIELAVEFIMGMIAGESILLYLVLVLLSFAVSLLIQLGMVRLALNIATEKPTEFSQLFSETALIARFLGASILYGIIVMVGFILLFIPGVIWAIKYGQYMYLIVDKKLGVIESLKMSATITNGAKWDILIAGFVMMVIAGLSAIPLGLGLVITIPLSLVYSAFIYLALLRRNENPQGVSETPATATTEPFVPLAPEGQNPASEKVAN